MAGLSGTMLDEPLLIEDASAVGSTGLEAEGGAAIVGKLDIFKAKWEDSSAAKSIGRAQTKLVTEIGTTIDGVFEKMALRNEQPKLPDALQGHVGTSIFGVSKLKIAPTNFTCRPSGTA